MTAAYLKSEFQKALEQQLASIDPQSPAFLDSAPLCIDCRADAAAFRARLTPTQLGAIEALHAKGGLTGVSGLARLARAYAIDQLGERFDALDGAARALVRALLSQWRAGRGTMSDTPGWDGGIDIILPVSGIRLSYDLSDLMPFE